MSVLTKGNSWNIQYHLYKMDKFGFSSENQTSQLPVFHGPTFYNVYKHSEFLDDAQNIENILTRGHELRQKLSKVPAGTSVVIEGLMLSGSMPLLVKKSGPGITVEKHEFTYNRLVGLVAAFVYENRQKYPKIVCSEAEALGLTWDCQNEDKCKLYLSAVSGTEHFCNVFSYWPLICAARKFQLGKFPEKLLIKIAKIKCNDNQIMAKVLRNNLIVTSHLWNMFPGSTPGDLQKILYVSSPQLQKLVFAE